MDAGQKLQLQQMIKANDTEDHTENIRNLKHSEQLRDDINLLIMLKRKYGNDPDQLNLEAMMECNFLFTYYTDIYNKVRKDEIDLQILFQFLDVLKKIEDGKLDQHEGSYEVGMLLKKLYVDSALKKADKINSQYENIKEEAPKETMQISWRQFKQSLPRL